MLPSLRSATSAAPSSVEAMMKKAVTQSNEFYREPNSVKGHATRLEESKAARKEKRGTLSQWYGMKRTPLTKDQTSDLELLQYRNFVSKDTSHQAPKRNPVDQTEFVEFGYFAGTGKNKRKKYKSFADEWIKENPELENVVNQRVKKNVKANKKAKEEKARREKKSASRKKEGKYDSKRRRNKGGDF